jgi:hypothetical protein
MVAVSAHGLRPDFGRHAVERLVVVTGEALDDRVLRRARVTDRPPLAVKNLSGVLGGEPCGAGR